MDNLHVNLLFSDFILLQAKALVDPFAYDSYIEQRKREKLENERASRITVGFRPIFERFLFKCTSKLFTL